MNEPLDLGPGFDHGVDDGLGPQHIGLEEGQAVEDRPRHVRLGGQMQDDVGLVHQHVDQGRVADIAVPEPQPRMAPLQHLLGQMLDRAGVRQQVQNDDPILGIVAREMMDEVCADEPGATGDENCTHGDCH